MLAYREFTEDEFDFFKDKCFEYHELFSLSEYDLKVLLENNLERRGAECRANPTQRQAQIILFQKTEIVHSNEVYEYLERTAIHEVTHILTCDYVALTGNAAGNDETKVSEAISNRVAEAVIRIKNKEEKK